MKTFATVSLEHRAQLCEPARRQLRAAGGELQQLGELLAGEPLERRPEPLERPPEEDVAAHHRVVLLQLGQLVLTDAAEQQLQLCNQ